MVNCGRLSLWPYFAMLIGRTDIAYLAVEKRLRMRSKALPTMASTAVGIAFVDGLLQLWAPGRRCAFTTSSSCRVEPPRNARLVFASAKQRGLDLAFQRIEGDVLQKRIALVPSFAAVGRWGRRRR